MPLSNHIGQYLFYKSTNSSTRGLGLREAWVGYWPLSECLSLDRQSDPADCALEVALPDKNPCWHKPSLGPRSLSQGHAWVPRGRVPTRKGKAVRSRHEWSAGQRQPGSPCPPVHPGDTQSVQAQLSPRVCVRQGWREGHPAYLDEEHWAPPGQSPSGSRPCPLGRPCPADAGAQRACGSPPRGPGPVPGPSASRGRSRASSSGPPSSESDSSL